MVSGDPRRGQRGDTQRSRQKLVTDLRRRQRIRPKRCPPLPKDGLVLHYDATKLDLQDGTLDIDWPNLGTAGPAWDMYEPFGDQKIVYVEDGINGLPAVGFGVTGDNTNSGLLTAKSDEANHITVTDGWTRFAVRRQNHYDHPARQGQDGHFWYFEHGVYRPDGSDRSAENADMLWYGYSVRQSSGRLDWEWYWELTNYADDAADHLQALLQHYEEGIETGAWLDSMNPMIISMRVLVDNDNNGTPINPNGWVNCDHIPTTEDTGGKQGDQDVSQPVVGIKEDWGDSTFVGEMLDYNRALSDEEWRAVLCNMGQKWGIPVPCA